MNQIAIIITLCLASTQAAFAFQQLGGWSAEQLQQILPQAQQQQQGPASAAAAGSLNPFAAAAAAGLQQAQPLTPQPAAQQFAPDLQNQVQALGAQLAAANRQIQFYQQQLSMVAGQTQAQQPQQVQSQPLNSPMNFQLQQQQQQQEQLQAQLQQQQQLQAALAAQRQQLAQQQQQQQQFQEAPQAQQLSPQQAQFLSQQQLLQQQQAQAQAQQQQQQSAPVSTLADNQQATGQLAGDPRLAGQSQFFAQQQQQQQLQAAQAQLESARFQQAQAQAQAPAAPTTSSSVEPSIEPSLAVQQPTAATASQQVPTSHAPVHSAPQNDDKFSIGLGVLSPGYTQKFGNTALDFNQDKNGYSFTLSNNGHSNQVPPQPTQKPAARA